MKVFVSHSSKDKWVARQISRLLETDGHTTFLDEKDIKTGDSIDASIQVHLKDSDHLVILLSPASITSHWVFIELGGAKALGKKVVPILFHVGANEIPSAISQLLARDINEFDKYLEELRAMPTVASEVKSTRKPTKAPKKPTASESDLGRQEPAWLTKGRFNGLGVGDKVRIVQVERLTTNDKEQSPTWVPAMDKYSGIDTHITELWPGGDYVHLSADGGEFAWSCNWISKID
jgi:hypothetical protein